MKIYKISQLLFPFPKFEPYSNVNYINNQPNAKFIPKRSQKIKNKRRKRK